MYEHGCNALRADGEIAFVVARGRGEAYEAQP
jgi:hypothetical protein